MASGDLSAGRQMLEVVGRRCPLRVTPENLSDPGFLSTGEHGADIVAERRDEGQRPAREIVFSPLISGEGPDGI